VHGHPLVVGHTLLTDDGELTNRLTHPRYEHEKEYRALVEGEPDEAVLEKWRQGVFLDGRRTAPAEVTVAGQEKGKTWLHVTWLRVVLREGRKRQIRRTAAMLGHPVHRLIRVRIGSLHLGHLKPGQWRTLTEAEVKALRATVAQPPSKARRTPRKRRAPATRNKPHRGGKRNR
jgi:pseudouridine synthase